MSILREALGIMAHRPVLLLTGGALGIFFSAGLLTELYLGSFIGERIAFFWGLILPVFIGGAYAVIQSEKPDLRTYFHEGIRQYFRILLPILIMGFALVVTFILITIPMGIMGAPSTSGSYLFLMMGLGIPFVFLCYFMDTAVVFEGAGVFESIRRSIEFVFNRFFSVMVFYIINMLIVLPAVGLVGFITEIMLLAGRPELAESLSTGNITALTPADIIAALGPSGVWAYTLATIMVMLPVGTLLVTYKACFFRKYAGRVATPVGEYDEKGRWYKY